MNHMSHRFSDSNWPARFPRLRQNPQQELLDDPDGWFATCQGDALVVFFIWFDIYRVTARVLYDIAVVFQLCCSTGLPQMILNWRSLNWIRTILAFDFRLFICYMRRRCSRLRLRCSRCMPWFGWLELLHSGQLSMWLENCRIRDWRSFCFCFLLFWF